MGVLERADQAREACLAVKELVVLHKCSLFTRIKRGWGKNGPSEEGSALVEMAFMLPLMMLVMTGIFGFSLLLFQQIQLVEAVSGAGHYLAVARGATDPCATAIASIKGQPGLSASSLTISMTQNGTALPTTCPTTGASSTLTSGATVNVSVQYQSELGIYWRKASLFTLNSQIQEIVQ